MPKSKSNIFIHGQNRSKNGENGENLCPDKSVRMLAHARAVQCPAANSGERSVVLESDRVGIGAVNDVSRKFIWKILVS